MPLGLGMTTAEDGRAPRGTRLPRPARRKQLLGAAQEVFVAHGYHAAAMDDIAERAGVSKPVLYQHFPSKLELYLRPARPARRRPARQGARGASTAPPTTRRASPPSVAAYFDFVDGEGSDGEGAFRLVFESDLRNDPAVRERVERMTQVRRRHRRDDRPRHRLPAEEAQLLVDRPLRPAWRSARAGG